MSKYIHARTSVYNVNYHIVWSTKYRRKVLVDEVEQHLKELVYQIAEDRGFEVRALEVMPDHVHVFATAHPKIAPGYIYKTLKGRTGRALLHHHKDLHKKLWKGQLWNPSTFVETIGSTSEEAVTRYIEEQKSG